MMGRVLIYLTIGFPDITSQIEFIGGINSRHIDGIELGFPSADPRYDGPVLRATHHPEVAADKTAIGSLLEACTKLTDSVNVLLYYSDYQRDSAVVDFFSSYGVRDFIVPDLLIDYVPKIDSLLLELENTRCNLVPFFNAGTPDRVISNLASKTSSWVYYGLQPSTGINMPYDIEAVVGRALELLPGREVNFGFGIRNQDDAMHIKRAGGEGIAIGSVLVNDLYRRDFTSAYRKISGFSEVMQNAV